MAELNSSATARHDDMEYLFPILFFVAFLITKKDLALVTAGASSLAVAVLTGTGAEWSFHAQLVFLVFCNLVIFLASANHWWRMGGKPLSRAMMWLSMSSIAATTVYLFNEELAPNLLLLLQLLSLLAILSLDGCKGFANDLGRLFVYPVRSGSNAGRGNRSGES